MIFFYFIFLESVWPVFNKIQNQINNFDQLLNQFERFNFKKKSWFNRLYTGLTNFLFIPTPYWPPYSI